MAKHNYLESVTSVVQAVKKLTIACSI